MPKRFSRLVILNGYRLGGYGGGILMTRAIIEALTDSHPNVVILGAREDSSHALAKRASLYVPIPPANIARKLLAVLSGTAIDRLYLTADRWLRRELEEGDVLVLNGAIIGRYAKFSDRCVTVHHNIESDYYAGELKKMVGKQILIDIAHRNQSCAIARGRKNLFLTESDRSRAMTLFGNAQISSMQPFLPSDISQLPKLKGDLPLCPRIKVLITGSLDNAQVVLPLVQFLQNVVPSLRKSFPDILIVCAGKNPSAECQQLCASCRVNLVANPETTEPLLEGANVYIAITDTGSGIKLRLTDPLRWGLPIIAHQASAVGFSGSGLPWLRVYESQNAICREIKWLAEKRTVPLSERLAMQAMFNERFSYEHQARTFSTTCLSGLS